MPTLHIRNVPASVYEALKTRAARNGRSINAEVIHVLQATVERGYPPGSITAELRRLARKINLPSDAPKPEDLIREDRDSR